MRLGGGLRPRALDWRLLVSLALFGAWAGLALTVNAGLWRPLDGAVYTLVVPATPCPVARAGTAASILLSAEVSVAGAAALAAVVGWRYRRWGAGWLIVGLLATAPVELTAKRLLVDQPAPSQTLQVERPKCGPELYPLPLRDPRSSHAFPSGATTRLAYFATLAGVAAGRLGRGRLLALAALLAATAAGAATRVLIGWHWPTDVAGGLLLGASAACGALWLLRWFNLGPERQERLA